MKFIKKGDERMALIKREPIGFISVKKGKTTINWIKTKKKGPCIVCGKKTRDTFQGFNECKRCRAFEGFGMCDRCEYGIPRSTYHCNGNDLEDHVTNYIACALRNDMIEKLVIPDFKSTCSSWHVSTKEKLKCFKDFVAFIKLAQEREKEHKYREEQEKQNES